LARPGNEIEAENVAQVCRFATPASSVQCPAVSGTVGDVSVAEHEK
jgi:hypothetical protein